MNDFLFDKGEPDTSTATVEGVCGKGCTVFSPPNGYASFDAKGEAPRGGNHEVTKTKTLSIGKSPFAP